MRQTRRDGRRRWKMVAVSLAHEETDILDLYMGPNEEKPMRPPRLTRDEALELVAAWNRYNEWWAYGLLEDECWQPTFFEFNKLDEHLGRIGKGENKL